MDTTKFQSCCCCIPLHVGSHILGILLWLGITIGFILTCCFLAGNSSTDNIATYIMFLFSIIPGVYYIIQARDPTPEKKMKWAKSYLYISLLNEVFIYYIVYLSYWVSQCSTWTLIDGSTVTGYCASYGTFYDSYTR